MNFNGILSHFVSFLFLLLFLWIGVTYVSQNIQYTCAKQFYNSAIVQIENSEFRDEIIQKCKTNAKKRGYQLTIETFGSSPAQMDGRVILKFDYLYPVIQIKKNYMIEGYAR